MREEAKKGSTKGSTDRVEQAQALDHAKGISLALALHTLFLLCYRVELQERADACSSGLWNSWQAQAMQ
jgi:hypothetical protein